MDLKELLGEELAGQVQAKLGENHKLIDTKEGAWIPKEKFDQLNSDKQELKNQLDQRDTQLEELSKKAKGNEELTAQINQYKQEIETTKSDYEKKLQQQTFDHSLEKSLSGAKARNPKAVKGLLDLDSIKLDGETLLGLDDQLKALKESDSYLFETDDEGGGGTKPNFSTGKHQSTGGGDAFANALLGK